MTIRRPRAPIGLSLAAVAVACWSALPGPLAAQVEATARFEGQVQLGGEPLADATVVLHVVSPETSGEVDSMRVGRDGRFGFDLPHVPDPENRSEVFFASVRFRDVLYFGAPVSDMAQLDSAYVIEVHDTTLVEAGAAPVTVAVRNVFLEGTEGGWRVTDLFQLLNEGDRTLVAPEGGFVWRYPLPPRARDFQAGDSHVAPEAMEFADGEVRVSAPLPPGGRMVVTRYVVDGVGFSIPMPGATQRAELLVREPAPPLAVMGLAPTEAVELDAATYRRFAGAELAGATVTLAEAEATRGLPVRWLAVGLALVLTLAAVFAMTRAPRAVAAGGGTAPTGPAGGAGAGAAATVEAGARERLLLEIAALDEAYDARGDAHDPSARETYERERASLLEDLKRSTG